MSINSNNFEGINDPQHIENNYQYYDTNRFTWCRLESLDFVINNIIAHIDKDSEFVIIHDVENKTANGSIGRHEYILTSLSYSYNNNYNIFVMNEHCARELGILYQRQTINIYNAYDISFEFFYQKYNYDFTNFRTDKTIFIITPNSIECDDKSIIYLGYCLSNQYINVKIISADDYTRSQHGNSSAVDVDVFNHIFAAEHNHRYKRFTSDNIYRISDVVSIYNDISDLEPRNNLSANREKDGAVVMRDMRYERNTIDDVKNTMHLKKYLKYKQKYIELKNKYNL